MQKHNWFEKQNMCPVIKSSFQTDDAYVRHRKFKLVLGAYGFEYKSYLPSLTNIHTS